MRLVGDRDAPPPRQARRAARPVAVETLVALPILAMPDGRPIDLLEAADGSAVILLFVSADAATLVGTYAAAAASLADRIAAAAGRVFIIAPRRRGVGWPVPSGPSPQDG